MYSSSVCFSCLASFSADKTKVSTLCQVRELHSACQRGTGITLIDGQSSREPALVPQFEGLSSATSQFGYIKRKIYEAFAPAVRRWSERPWPWIEMCGAASPCPARVRTAQGGGNLPAPSPLPTELTFVCSRLSPSSENTLGSF